MMCTDKAETWSRQVRTIYAQFSTCSMVTLVDHIDVVCIWTRRMIIKADFCSRKHQGQKSQNMEKKCIESAIQETLTKSRLSQNCQIVWSHNKTAHMQGLHFQRPRKSRHCCISCFKFEKVVYDKLEFIRLKHAEYQECWNFLWAVIQGGTRAPFSNSKVQNFKNPCFWSLAVLPSQV